MHATASMLGSAVSAVSTASTVPSQALQQVGPICQGITALSGPAEAEALAAASAASSPSSAASCATEQLCTVLVSAAAAGDPSRGPDKVGTVSGPSLTPHSSGPVMQHAVSVNCADVTLFLHLLSISKLLGYHMRHGVSDRAQSLFITCTRDTSCALVPT